MRIFLYEHICAAEASAEPGWDSLRTEGAAMLAALREDLAAVPGVEVLTLFTQAEAAFRARARTADATLVIAPEFDDILATRCQWVEESGGRLLGPAVAAVRLTGDKLALARHLGAHGIPTPPSASWPLTRMPEWPFPLVWKPRHGAGSQATFLVTDAAELAGCASRAASEGWHAEAIVQPFVPGRAVSVALLVGPRQVVPLLPAAQDLSTEGRFRYRGGRLPLPEELAARAARLAGRAVRAVPGLRGYVGVDLVLGAAADGSQDWVIEINPRLTTSYVGLRALAESNLADSLLRVIDGKAIAPLAWRPGSVQFQPDGTVLASHSPDVASSNPQPPAEPTAPAPATEH